jgi:hypothetical protein
MRGVRVSLLPDKMEKSVTRYFTDTLYYEERGRERSLSRENLQDENYY